VSFDAADEFIKYRNEYAARRGWGFAPSGKGYPRTTWGEVTAFWSLFTKATGPGSCDMPEVSAGSIITVFGQSAVTTALGQQCITYLKSSAFQAAAAAWQAANPSQYAIGRWGLYTGPAEMSRAIVDNVEYPDNATFWNVGEKYAIARSAAGKVQGDFQRMADSVDKAIDDLPSTIKSALEAVNPGNLIPDVSSWVELIKWGSVLGGIGILYWYVLRPKDKKK
jgi:hypothetical protein